MTRLHAFNRDQLLASARGELFGAAAGRLPNDPMLMFDRITEIREDGGPQGKGMARAEPYIRPAPRFSGSRSIPDPVTPCRLARVSTCPRTRFYLPCSGGPRTGRALGRGHPQHTGTVLR